MRCLTNYNQFGWEYFRRGKEKDGLSLVLGVMRVFCGFVGCFRVFDIGLYIILGVFLAVSLNTSICMDKIGVSSFILVNKITKISHKSITYTILHTIKKYPKNFPKKTP